jgi:hypothetical protein
MSKAQNSTTNRRRFLRLAGVTAAATALLAAPALATRNDARLFAMIARVRPMLAALTAAGERAHSAYALADADPDMPGGQISFVRDMRERGSLLSEDALERLWEARANTVRNRHGYHAAYDQWNTLDSEFRPILARLLAMRPNTAQGALEKWQLVFAGHLETSQCEPEDVEEFLMPAMLADLKRLAGKAVQS